MEKFRKYFDFDGRITRSEYWAIYLITIGLMFPVTFVIGLMAMTHSIIGILLSTALMVLFFVGLLVVYGATSAKRCRDAGISPWFALALLIPTIQFICFIVFGCLPSEKEENVN
jgi:uncharacterized membrane protein YhaH (DUF805 family)